METRATKVTRDFGEMFDFRHMGLLVSHRQEDMEELCISFLCPLQKDTLDYSCLGKFSVKQDFYWKTVAFNTFKYVWS